MFHDTQPARLDTDGRLDPWAEFRVVHDADIESWLRRLQQSAAPVVLATPSGHSMQTVLWVQDAQARRLVFSAHGAARAQLQALAEAQEIVAVAYLDRVKVQFELSHVLLVFSDTSQALQAPWPEVLYRFQRRDSFRVRPLPNGAPTATLRHPGFPDMLLELRVLDLSIGGCALLLPQDMPPVQPGLLIHGVQVVLDAATAFVASIELQHVSSMSGTDVGQRLGCEWHRLAPDAERALARYVDQTQKRQRLLSLD